MFEYDPIADTIRMAPAQISVAHRINGKWLCDPSGEINSRIRLVIWLSFCSNAKLQFKAGDLVSLFLNDVVSGWDYNNPDPDYGVIMQRLQQPHPH